MNLATLKALVEKLCDKLDKVSEDTKGLLALAYAHGQMYRGANYGEELRAVRAALAESKPKGGATVEPGSQPAQAPDGQSQCKEGK